VTAEKIQSLGTNIRYVKGSLVPGTAASNSAVIALGILGRFKPVTQPTAVTQTLTLWR
jgi:hypothetical protein